MAAGRAVLSKPSVPQAAPKRVFGQASQTGCVFGTKVSLYTVNVRHRNLRATAEIVKKFKEKILRKLSSDRAKPTMKSIANLDVRMV